MKVYNQDVNRLLKHAADKKTASLCAIGDRFEKLPKLPEPGEVDIIMGGPPCQPYSGANNHKVSHILAELDESLKPLFLHRKSTISGVSVYKYS